MGKVLDMEPRLEKQRRRVTKRQYDTYLRNLTRFRDEVLLTKAGFRKMATRAAVVYLVTFTLGNLIMLFKSPFWGFSPWVVLGPLLLSSIVAVIVWQVADWKHFTLDMNAMELNSIVQGWESFGQSFEANYISECRLGQDAYWDATTKLFHQKVRETAYRLKDNKFTDPNGADQ